MKGGYTMPVKNTKPVEPLTMIGKAVLTNDGIEMLEEFQEENNSLLKDLTYKLLKSVAFISNNLSEYKGKEHEKAEEALEFISTAVDFLETFKKP